MTLQRDFLYVQHSLLCWSRKSEQPVVNILIFHTDRTAISWKVDPEVLSSCSPDRNLTPPPCSSEELINILHLSASKTTCVCVAVRCENMSTRHLDRRFVRDSITNTWPPPAGSGVSNNERKCQGHIRRIQLRAGYEDDHRLCVSRRPTVHAHLVSLSLR